MSNQGLNKLLLFLSLVLFCQAVTAQVKNHLPYSIFGIGEIKSKGFGRNLAMGKSGIALSSGMFLNNLNPASYNAMDSISFFFDFGLSADFVKYATENNNSQRGHDINMRNIAMGFRVNRKWSAGIGIIPFSTVAYQITSTGNVEGTTDIFNMEQTGSGGLNQFYWDNSYEIFKNLSLGVNASYLFGNIESREEIFYDKFTYSIISTKTSRLNKVYLDFGIQYHLPVGKNLVFSMGGVFGNTHRLNFKESISVSQSNGLVFEDKVTREGTFNLPLYYGGGVAIAWAGKLTISGDYLFHDWSSITSENTEYEYLSNHSFRVGAEYIPASLNQLGYLGRITYRAGYYHDGSYVRIRNTPISDNGITLGIGIPFLKNKTSINLSYNSGIKGSMENGLIRQNYHSVFLSLTLHDWWFIKPKYD